jgi:predicted CoA-binding protein
MDETIQSFIENKKIALLGASRTGRKFGNTAARELIERGYEVFIIHPNVDEINGLSTYPNIEAVKDQVESLFISIPSDQVEPILRQASTAKITKVWLQQGAESPDLISLAQDLGLDLIAGKCILMYAEPVRSFHRFHQVIWKLIGQY